MFLNNDFPYIKSFRNHLIIAIILGLFVDFIVIFLQPYGAGLNEFPYKTLYFIGYGIVNFLIYLVTYLVFNRYYQKTKKWKWAEELFFTFCYVFIMIFVAKLYTELAINKNPSRINLTYVIGWYKTVFPGFGILLIVITIILHQYIGKENSTNVTIKRINEKANDNSLTITIHSSLKKESLTILQESIAYIESEDNYVHIYFYKNNSLEQKMLRNTLKNIQKQLPFLVKTHRSFIVNPKYILHLKGNSQNAKLYLKSIQNTIPISKTYYENIKNYIV